MAFFTVFLTARAEKNCQFAKFSNSPPSPKSRQKIFEYMRKREFNNLQ